jgi:branched-chain amino acid transport system ATP-binding protein
MSGPAGATRLLLELTGVSCRSGGALLLDRIALAVEPGALVGVIGPSGAGKTALLDAISGLLPRHGPIHLAGRPLPTTPERVARAGIGRSFERPVALPGATVFECVALAVAMAEGAGFASMLLRADAPRPRHERLVWSTLGEAGIEALADHPPTGLPLAEARRLELARALAGRPRLLLLDQPARGLAAAERGALARTLERLVERGLTILLAEHDITLVTRLCHRVVVLDRGRKIAEGAPGEVGDDPDVLHAFAGTTVL